MTNQLRDRITVSAVTVLHMIETNHFKDNLILNEKEMIFEIVNLLEI